MKKIAIALTLSASLVGLAACSNTDSADPKVVVSSKAGDIKKDDFYKELKKRNGKEVLKQMITIKVLEDKYKVSDQDVNADLKTLKDQLGDGYKSALEQQGMTEKDLKESLRLNILQQEAMTDGIKVKEADMKKQYDRMKTEIKAQHILVKDKETAEKVKKELDNGGDFAKLAKKYSTDDGTKEKGGNLGYFSTGEMDENFENAAYKLKVGQISEPVQSNFGYHIIKVLDKRDKKNVQPYDKAKDKIHRDLAVKKVDPVKAQEKMDKLIKNADVKIKIKGYKDLLKEDNSATTMPQG